MPSTLNIRAMRSADLDSVVAIQALCYGGDIRETRASLAAKLQASPATCFIAELAEVAVAYVIALPWRAAAPPQLNAQECILPAQPDCLYLHDLAVTPASRKTGAGRALVAAFFEAWKTHAYPFANLVAVQDSGAYWRGYGFDSADLTPELRQKLSSYGDAAEYLTMPLHALSSQRR
jgi:ribosomal protein S18 acetylase RimI-like enzyme